MSDEKILCPNCKFDCTNKGEEFYGETKQGYL